MAGLGKALGQPLGPPLSLKRKADRIRVFRVLGASAGSSGTLEITESCLMLCYLIGGGGAGGQQPTNACGGGGAAALYAEVKLLRGQSIAYSIGSGGAVQGNGGDTVITLPDGRRLVAGGGRGGSPSTPGAGGVATGGMINRNGGAGGVASSSGLAGQKGATGGISGSGSHGGGGGSAGIPEQPVMPQSGGGSNGGSGGSGGLYGGGAGAHSSSPNGGDGYAIIVLARNL